MQLVHKYAVSAQLVRKCAVGAQLPHNMKVLHNLQGMHLPYKSLTHYNLKGTRAKTYIHRHTHSK